MCFFYFFLLQKPEFKGDSVEIDIDGNTFTLPMRLISTTHDMTVDEDKIPEYIHQLSIHISSFEYKDHNESGDSTRRKKRRKFTSPPPTPDRDNHTNIVSPPPAYKPSSPIANQ